MNNVMLTGNLTKDLELRYIPESQTAVANGTLAVKRPHTKDKTDFIPIVLFGKTAENAEKFLAKGSKILVQGVLVIDQYKKDGENKSFTKVNCDTFEFLDSKQNQQSDGAEPKREPTIPEGFAMMPDDDEPY